MQYPSLLPHFHSEMTHLRAKFFSKSDPAEEECYSPSVAARNRLK